MSKITIINVFLLFFYLVLCKRISYETINKKLNRALISSIVFSTLGIVKLILLKNKINLEIIICYIFVEIVIIIASIGIYKKNKIAAIAAFIFTMISLYADYSIDKSKTLPIIVFVIYLRTLVYFNIFWDGILSNYAYYRKIRIEEQSIEINFKNV